MLQNNNSNAIKTLIQMHIHAIVVPITGTSFKYARPCAWVSGSFMCVCISNIVKAEKTRRKLTPYSYVWPYFILPITYH